MRFPSKSERILKSILQNDDSTFHSEAKRGSAGLCYTNGKTKLKAKGLVAIWVISGDTENLGAQNSGLKPAKIKIKCLDNTYKSKALKNR